MKRDYRPKASEIFAGSRALTGKTTFEKEFPDIVAIDIIVEIFSNEFHLDKNKISEEQYDISTFPGEFVDCRNLDCHGGGVSIGSMIREMYTNRTTDKVAKKTCRGKEASLKGKKIYGPCFYRFHVKIQINYRETSDT